VLVFLGIPVWVTFVPSICSVSIYLFLVAVLNNLFDSAYLMSSVFSFPPPNCIMRSTLFRVVLSPFRRLLNTTVSACVVCPGGTTRFFLFVASSYGAPRVPLVVSDRIAEAVVSSLSRFPSSGMIILDTGAFWLYWYVGFGFFERCVFYASFLWNGSSFSFQGSPKFYVAYLIPVRSLGFSP